MLKGEIRLLRVHWGIQYVMKMNFISFDNYYMDN